MPWIKLTDVAHSDLPGSEKVRLMAEAIEQVALAKALEIIHGDRWAREYVAKGGRVRTVGDNEVCLWTQHETDKAVVLDA